jgi:hypothetical protein
MVQGPHHGGPTSPYDIRKALAASVFKQVLTNLQLTIWALEFFFLFIDVLQCHHFLA